MENPLVFLSRGYFKREKSFKKRKTFSVASFIEEVARSDGGVFEDKIPFDTASFISLLHINWQFQKSAAVAKHSSNRHSA